MLLLLLSVVLGIFSSGTVSAALRLNKKQVSIYVGSSIRLKPNSGTGKRWTSSDVSVAKVTSKGLVRGLSKGTVTISCTVSGKRISCTVNVRNRNLSQYMTNAQVQIWMNMIGAVESGGQVYGQRDYTSFAGPGANTSAEVSSTAGAYQEYGENLRQLLIAIRTQYPYTFRKLDTAGIASDLSYAWYGSNSYQVYPGSAKALCIQKLIGSSQGRLVQDIRCAELLDEYLTEIKTLGVTSLRAGLFLAECDHLGGFSAVKRVVARAKNRNKIAALRKSLYQDQNDPASNQIGDSFYYSRHQAMYKWIVAHIPASARF